MKNKDILMAVTRTTLITGLLIVMYACGKEDIEIENINQIKFTAEVNAQFSTRAALTGTEVENIGIFAYSSLQDIDELFENEELTKQDGYFEYSTQARYYQKDEEISYLAYSPYNEEISYAVDETNNKVTFSGYKLPNGYAEEDLLLSGFTTENTSIVSIHFKHALSALGFKVKGDPNYKVTYLAICRIYNNADFSLDNQGNIEWSNRSIDIADSDQTTIFPVNLADSTTPSSTDTAISLIEDNGYLLMIPQVLRADAYLQVQIESSGGDEESDVFTHYIPLCDYPEWEIGCYHIYTIEINEDSLSLSVSS